MNKYYYKGQTITASSKQDAIKQIITSGTGENSKFKAYLQFKDKKLLVGFGSHTDNQLCIAMYDALKSNGFENLSSLAIHLYRYNYGAAEYTFSHYPYYPESAEIKFKNFVLRKLAKTKECKDFEFKITKIEDLGYKSKLGQKTDESKLSDFGKTTINKMNEVVKFLKSKIDRKTYEIKYGFIHDRSHNNSDFNYRDSDDFKWVEDGAEADILLVNKKVKNKYYNVRIHIVTYDSFSPKTIVYIQESHGYTEKNKDFFGFIKTQVVNNLDDIFKYTPYLKNFDNTMLKLIYDRPKSKYYKKIPFNQFKEKFGEKILKEVYRSSKNEPFLIYMKIKKQFVSEK